MGCLTIRIPEKLRRELDQLSRDKQRAISDLIREALHRYVALEHFRALREQIRPFAEAQGFFTDDDLFKII
jgi:predicted transcriptional regulator